MSGKKINGWFTNHITMMHYILTALICFAEYKFLPNYPEHTFLITILATLFLLVCLYAALFGNGCKMLFHKTLCGLLVVFFANHLYDRNNLNAAFPTLANLSNIELAVLFLGVALIVLMLVSLISSARDQFPSESSSTPTGDSPVPSSAKSVPTKNMPKRKLQIPVFTLVLLALLAATCYIFGIIYTKGMPDWNSNNFFDVAAFLGSYGGTLLLVLVVIIIILYAFVEAIRLIYSRLMMPISPPKEEQGPPTYVFSVIITIVLFYLSYSVGGMSLDTFTDIINSGQHLVLPLTIIVILVAFLVIVRIIHGVLLILMELKPEDVKKFISEKEKVSHISERLYTIFQILLDIVLGTILTALRFVVFIPNFFRDLYNFVFLEDGDEVENDFITLSNSRSEIPGKESILEETPVSEQSSDSPSSDK